MIAAALGWITGAWWRTAALVALAGLILAALAGVRILGLRADLAQARADLVATRSILTLANTRINLMDQDAAALRRAVSALQEQLTATQAQARRDASRTADRRRIMATARTVPTSTLQPEVVDNATSRQVVDHINDILSGLGR